jgi:hypothetical protein
MITVKGAPTEGDFAEVPSTDYDTSVLVRIIKQEGGSYSRLSILKGDVFISGMVERI